MSEQRTLHVSPTGSNRGDGSIEKPIKDLQKAIDTAANGDQILVAEGNYLGKLDQGFIEITDKYITIKGGYSPDFTECNPMKHITSIRPTLAQQGTCGSKGTLHIVLRGQPEAELVIDGIAIDRGQMNKYCKPMPDDARTSTPNDRFETGRILFPGENPGPVMDGFTVKEPLLRAEIEGKLTVRNCIFANGANYGIMAAIRPTGHVEVENNIFVSNCFAACQVGGNQIKQDQCTLNFHHNTVLFSWCRDKTMGDMGYGLRYMTGLHTKAWNNIFACSNLGALDRGYIDSNKAVEEARETSATDNLFFMNKADLILPSGGGLWLQVAAEQFEDAEQLREYEGNRQLAEAESAFTEAINRDHLEAFATISSSNTSNFNPNSAANLFNRAMGMNLQGTETIRPTMYANRYPYDEVFKLWGAVEGYGAQTVE